MGGARLWGSSRYTRIVGAIAFEVSYCRQRQTRPREKRDAQAWQRGEGARTSTRSQWGASGRGRRSRVAQSRAAVAPLLSPTRREMRELFSSISRTTATALLTPVTPSHVSITATWPLAACPAPMEPLRNTRLRCSDPPLKGDPPDQLNLNRLVKCFRRSFLTTLTRAPD